VKNRKQPTKCEISWKTLPWAKSRQNLMQFGNAVTTCARANHAASERTIHDEEWQKNSGNTGGQAKRTEQQACQPHQTQITTVRHSNCCDRSKVTQNTTQNGMVHAMDRSASSCRKPNPPNFHKDPPRIQAPKVLSTPLWRRPPPI
jgi:hypothetical protein